MVFNSLNYYVCFITILYTQCKYCDLQIFLLCLELTVINKLEKITFRLVSKIIPKRKFKLCTRLIIV